MSPPSSDSSFERLLLDAASSEIRSVRLAAEHLIQAGGKRVRPRFATLLGELFRCESGLADAIGTAAELVHTATLLHDDIIDRSEVRRGQATVHSKFGVGHAVLAGDFLLARALHGLTERGLFEATHELTVAVRELVEAELLQFEQAYTPETTLAQTRRIAEGKTGALFAWCARGIAVTMRLSPDQVAVADSLGRRTGYAFQVADDLLDLTNPDSGKPIHKDLREGQLTVPVQLARPEDPALDAVLGKAFESRTEADFEVAYDAIETSSARSRGQQEITRCREEMLRDALTLFTDPRSSQSLGDFFDRHVQGHA